MPFRARRLVCESAIKHARRCKTREQHLDPLRAKHPCGKCAFYSDSVWQPVAHASVKFLTRGFKRKDLAQGALAYGQGEDNKGVFCVSRGLVALRSLQEDGSSTLLRLAYPGDVIGFRSFLRSGPHQTEAVAIVPSRLCVVSQRDVSHLVKTSPEVLARLATRCVDEIDHSHQQIIAMATKSNKERLAQFLVSLLDRYGERVDNNIQMHLPLSRKDLADLIGVPQETLSRLVGRLQKDGYFSISGRHVSVPTSHTLQWFRD